MQVHWKMRLTSGSCLPIVAFPPSLPSFPRSFPSPHLVTEGMKLSSGGVFLGMSSEGRLQLALKIRPPEGLDNAIAQNPQSVREPALIQSKQPS